MADKSAAYCTSSFHSQSYSVYNLAIWVLKTSLNPPLLIKVPGPSQKSECIRVLGVYILPLSTILKFNFGIIPTVWYFFAFHFIILFD